MKLLADQDVYAVTTKFLTDLGHDVVTAAQLGLAQAEDVELLRAARAQGRLLVTRDRDFGGLVFVADEGIGVLYRRMLPSTQKAVHAELERVFTLYREEELQKSFLVIEAGRHRIRRPTPDQKSTQPPTDQP